MSAPRRRPPALARAILRVSIPAGTLRDSILEEFAEESGTEVHPTTKGFLDKLKDFFE